MIRHWQHVLCGALILCIASQNELALQETLPVKRSVQIYLTVLRRSDSPPVSSVSPLSAFVDEQPVQVTSLRPANEEELLFAVLVDISESNAAKAALIKQSALQLFKGLLDGRNEGHLVFFNSQVAVRKSPIQLSEVQTALDSLHFRGSTALYDAVADTCTKILSRSGNPEIPRRAIFLLTDGEDNASQINHQRAEEIAEREGVAIFSLQTGFDRMSAAEARHAVRFLQEASQNTGGQAVEVGKQGEGVLFLLKAIREQWALDLALPQTSDQKMHSFAIKSSEKNIQFAAPIQILLQ